ncbi:unnamed protein product [Sphacelaria rigidula]
MFQYPFSPSPFVVGLVRSSSTIFWFLFSFPPFRGVDLASLLVFFPVLHSMKIIYFLVLSYLIPPCVSSSSENVDPIFRVHHPFLVKQFKSWSKHCTKRVGNEYLLGHCTMTELLI